MYAVKQSATNLLPVILRNLSTGLPLLLVPYSSVSATIYKSDGTTANLTVTSPDWAELSSGAFNGSGAYTLLLPTSATNTVGRLLVAVAVVGALDIPVMVIDIVANLESDTTTTLATLATAAALTTVGSNVTAIKAKTDNLPSDPADESLIEAAITAATSPLATASALTTVGGNVTSIKTKTDNLPTDPADESLIEAAIAAAVSPLATAAGVTSATSPLATAASLTTVAGNVTAIKTKTDNLPGDPADESSLEAVVSALSASLADVPSGLASIKAATDTLVNRKKIFSAVDIDVPGSAANREICFDADGETPLLAWDLFDENGDPTSGPNVLDRVPASLE